MLELNINSLKKPKMKLRAIVIAVLLMLLAHVARAIDVRYSQLPEYPFIVVSDPDVQFAPEIGEEEFFEMSTSVIFRVNRTEVDPNAEFFRIYRSQILPMVNERHLQLRKVFIRGAASPEGPYWNNQRLGRLRGQALMAELTRDMQHQYLEVDHEVVSVTEDYGFLCRLMQQAQDPDYDAVRQVYDECGADELCCKQRLMRLQGGRLWQRLLRQYFPQLRAARIVLWFSQPDAQHAPVDYTSFGLQPVADSLQGQLALIDVPEMAHRSRSQMGDDTDRLHQRRRHMVAVRTNLVHDLFYMPRVGWSPSTNIQLEYYPMGGHLTYNLGMTWGTHRHWDTHDFFQVRDFQFELRRYFRGGGRFTGAYLAAHLHGDVYGIGLDAQKGWEGEGAAASLSAGYVLPLTRRGDLRLEFMAEAGYFITRFDPYVYGNPVTGTQNGLYYYDYLGSASKFKKRNHQFTWLGPLNVGIQLTYDIIYRTRKKSMQWKGGDV